MQNSNIVKAVCLSEQSVAFIKEYVFKPLHTTFYIDKKMFDAICDWALSCYDYSNYDRFDPIKANLGKTFYCEIHNIKKHGIIDFSDLNLRLNVQLQPINDEKIDKKYLELLLLTYHQIDPQNEVLWQWNFDKRLAELSKNLDETIEYLDTCSEEELDFMREVFEELSEHFKSQKLIDCVERNIIRFDNPELQKELKWELGFMKDYL